MQSSPRPAVVVLAVLGTLAVLGATLQAPPASAQISRNVTLLSHLDLYGEAATGLGAYFSCWSYVHHDGREYAVILTAEGASFVRLTDPTNPVEVGFLQAPSGLVPGIGEVRRAYVEAKQYGSYVYLVTELVRNFDFTVDQNAEGLAIVDMRNPDQPHKVPSAQSPIGGAHTLTIDQDRGLLFTNGTTNCVDEFTCENTVSIFSLADPTNPQFLSSFPGYVHDTHVRGNRAYFSMIFEPITDPEIAAFEAGDGARHGDLPETEGGLLIIVDLTDPTNPIELARIVTDRTLQHSSWTSEDGRYLYMANEVTRDGLTVWDVEDLSNIRQVFTFEDLPAHVVHQPHVVGNTLSVAYYTAGVRLMDIRNPAWPVEFGFYDTYAGSDGYFNGAWECAPYYPSGIFVVSDIQSGLWVFRAEPTNYGIVRGTVRQFPNGPTIAGATVTVQPSGLTVKTGLDGRYAFAVPTTGSATVTVSAYSFEVTSATVAVPLDSDQTLNIALRKLPSGTLRGTVRSAAGAPVAGAELQILNTPHTAVTDASGAYTVSSVPEGTYQVRAARSGLAAGTRGVTLPKNQTTTLDFTLGTPSFFDDVETDQGWTIGVPGEFNVGGRWARLDPIAKHNCDTGDEYQPEDDHTPAPGITAFITDNFQIPCATVFGGVRGITSLTSPALSLTGLTDSRIGYWYWYVNALPRVPGVLPLHVRLSADGGTTWITAKTITTSTFAWVFDEIRVADFFPSATSVRIRFVVDNGLFDLAFAPEAGLDDIAAYSGSGGGSLAPALASPAPAFAVSAPRPSPTRGATEIELSLSRETHVRADVFDLHGRLVRTALDRTVPSGQTVFRWDGKTRSGEPVSSGIYWMALRAGEVERKIRLVVVR